MSLRKAMHRGGKHVDADERHEEETKRPQGKQCRPPSAPPEGEPLMEYEGIKYPGHQRPHLLGVPAPVAPPNGARPDRTGDRPERKDRKTPRRET